MLTDIGPLIDRNLAFILDKGQEVLDCLEDGMSFDQWIYTFCKKENVRTHNEFKFSVVERNFANFVDWLADEGRIAGILRQALFPQGCVKQTIALGGRKPAIIGGHPCKYNENLRY